MAKANPNTEKKRRQRANIRKDEDRLAAYKAKDAKRKREARKKLKDELQKHPRLRASHQLKKRNEMREYRKKKKEENKAADDFEPQSARSEAAKAREAKKADRKRKRTERELIKAKKENAKLNMNAWRLRIKLNESEKQSQEMSSEHSKHSPFASRTTENRAIKRAKDKLPKTPQKKAHIIQKLTESPNTSKILEERGVINSKTTRRSLEIAEDVIGSLSEHIASVKPTKGRPTTEKRDAYKTLRAVIDRKPKLRLNKRLRKKLGVSKAKRSATNPSWWKTKTKKRKDAIPAVVKQRVQNFYLSPDISREVPDKRATIKIKEKGGKKVQILQRHNMMMTLDDAYRIYKEENPTDKIGMSSFAKFRPIQVKKVSETNRRSCLCQTCCNAALKAEALNKFAKTLPDQHEVMTKKQDVIDATVCPYVESPKPNCLNRSCKDCGPAKLKELYHDLLNGNENTQITWNKWGRVNVDKGDGKTKPITTCQTMETSLNDFMDAYMRDMNDLPGHIFRAQWQQKQLKQCIETLGNNEVCMCMDYAESYQCRFQSEIQSAFFEQNSVTIHPIVAYYKEEDMLVKHSIVGITDDIHKDFAGVKCFEEDALTKIETQTGKSISCIHEFTDGCANQYKGRKAFYELAQRKQINVTRNFYETSHGKSVCDGVGAVVKSSAHNAVLSGKEIIRGPKDFSEFCEKKLTVTHKVNKADGTISRRDFSFIGKEKADRTGQDVNSLEGTRILHSIRSVSWGDNMTLEKRNLSCYCQACRGTSPGPCKSQAYVAKWKEAKLTFKKEKGSKRTKATKPSACIQSKYCIKKLKYNLTFYP